MRTFSKVLAVVLCVAMLFTSAFASGLKVSFVDFQANGGDITARVNLRNDDSANALSGKVIVASYDESGNLVATGESAKTDVAKGAETIVSASVASGASSYKAFVWNDSFNPNSKHAIKGAIESTDFVKDNGTSNGFKSKTAVNDTKFAKTDAVVYTGLNARTAEDSSTEYGARYTSNMGASSTQYHEVTYVDPSLEGLDYFAFVAGATNYSGLGNLLEFDIVKNAEVMILASHTTLEFEGYDLIKAEDVAADKEKFVRGRYMDGDFTAALRAVGVTPTYELANIYNEDKEGFYDAYLAAGYEAATDANKATFTEEWNSFTGNGKHNKASYTYPEPYVAIYSKTYRLEDGEETAHVVIPEEGTGTSTRNILVVVKPTGNADTSEAFVPLTSAGNINAAPALKGVEIDGTFVSADAFTDNAYTYKLNALGDRVLPVVKGIPTDSALYATTDYDIAADGETAVITVTVKNLYTNAAPVVYTINVSVDTENLPADAYDVVNLNGKTIVNNTNALVEKTATVEGIKTHGNPLAAAPVSKVSGKTYAEYIAYVNEYYGYEEGDAEYIVGTGVAREGDVVGTNSYFRYAKDFEVGNALGTESNRRQIASINPSYAFYRNLYRMYSSISLSQLGGHGFTGGLWYGKDYEYTTGYNAKAGTDKLPAVPWFEATMATKGTVYVNSYAALPHLVERGYKLISNDIAPYTGIDTNNNGNFATPKYIYYKVFNAGDKVEIFNDNHQYTGNFHPSSWFFTTGIRDEYSYEYGKKSSAAVATYNTTTKVTDGVLYKDLFADVVSSRDTTGGQWVSDFQPLGAGQRIKSVEDPSLNGCDYFAFSINNRQKLGTAPGTNILEFQVDKDAEVVVLTLYADRNAVFGDFEKKENVPGLSTMFPQSNYFEAVKALGIPTTDISMDMVADFYPSSGLTFKQLYDKWLGAEFPGTTPEELLNAVNVAVRKQGTLASELNKIGSDAQFFASVDSKAAAIGGSHVNYVYDVTYTKSFKAGDTVAIPDPTGETDWARPIMVVVKPLVGTTIKDHVSDFQIVASTGAGSFILGPGANATASKTYSDRLIHCSSTEPGVAPVASAYSINNQRIFRETDEVLGLENCYYLKYVNQASVDTVLKNNAEWIGGADKADLPWMTFTVNQDCDIIIVPSAETPKFVTRAENGWSKNTLADHAFTLSRKTDNGGGSYQDYTGNSQKVMYVKSYKAGDTVTLYNGNNGTASHSYDKLPYFAFVRVK